MKKVNIKLAEVLVNTGKRNYKADDTGSVEWKTSEGIKGKASLSDLIDAYRRYNSKEEFGYEKVGRAMIYDDEVAEKTLILSEYFEDFDTLKRMYESEVITKEVFDEGWENNVNRIISELKEIFTK